MMQLELFGTEGTAEWNLEFPDEYRVALRSVGRPGFTRVQIDTSDPGAKPLLIGKWPGTGLGFLAPATAMWGEFLDALQTGRPTAANFADGVRANAVLDALYASAETGRTVEVTRYDEELA